MDGESARVADRTGPRVENALLVQMNERELRVVVRPDAAARGDVQCIAVDDRVEPAPGAEFVDLRARVVPADQPRRANRLRPAALAEYALVEIAGPDAPFRSRLYVFDAVTQAEVPDKPAVAVVQAGVAIEIVTPAVDGPAAHEHELAVRQRLHMMKVPSLVRDFDQLHVAVTDAQYPVTVRLPALDLRKSRAASTLCVVIDRPAMHQRIEVAVRSRTQVDQRRIRQVTGKV